MKEAWDINWFDLSRLLEGTPSQRSAACTLVESRVMELLAPYTPILCGTVPINCDIPGSDLDIICYAPNLPVFKESLYLFFSDKPVFSCEEKTLAGEHSVIARFRLGSWPVKITGQNIPVTGQRSFMHMLAEALLLSKSSPGAKQEIRLLKRQGKSTEEAFCAHFKIPGEPHHALVELFGNEVINRLK